MINVVTDNLEGHTIFVLYSFYSGKVWQIMNRNVLYNHEEL